ncbi:MAG: PatB family C-S lyase [Bacteroidales bacterium]
MKHIDRHGSYCVKIDALKKYYGREDVISLWVADMDFETPTCIREALEEVLAKKVYGYNYIPDTYFPTIANWISNQQGWNVEQEWLSFIPGIVKGIGYAINFFTKQGDGIIVQPPVYPPFINVPKGNNRNVIYNPLIKTESGYAMDFDNLEQILASGNAKMLILCNPHNPGGIIWGKEVLIQLAVLCHKYHVLVVADEIHADMPLFGNKHIPFASVSKEATQISISFGAPSKTFNMAGIVSSYAVVPNAAIREPFYTWMTVNELNSPTIFATVGAIAAYTHGLPWRDQMLKYIEGNVEFVEKYCKDHFGDLVCPMHPQSSFLVWLDCRELAKRCSVSDLFLNKAGLALNDGATFGPGGEGYMRLNVGCGREVLEQALENLKKSINLI